jgi:hypothetical protein
MRRRRNSLPSVAFAIRDCRVTTPCTYHLTVPVNGGESAASSLMNATLRGMSTRGAGANAFVLATMARSTRETKVETCMVMLLSSIL